MEKKLELIKNIKVIMMLSIVLYHSCMFFTGNWFNALGTPQYSSKYIVYFAKWLNTFHVQTFAMASGFIFYCLRTEKLKYNQPGKDMLKRARKLLLPYYAVVLTYVIPIDIMFDEFNFKQAVSKYFVGNEPGYLWFLLMLFWEYVFFYYIFGKIEVSLRVLLGIGLFSIIAYSLSGKVIGNILQISTAFRYTVFYYFGALLYKKSSIDNVKLSKVIVLWIGSVVSFIAVEYLESAQYIFCGKLCYKLLSVICSIIGILMVYYTVAYLLQFKRKAFDKIMWKLLCDNSFGIYLFHQPVIYFTIGILNGKVLPIVQVLISFVISLLVANVIVMILKKCKYTKYIYQL